MKISNVNELMSMKNRTNILPRYKIMDFVLAVEGNCPEEYNRYNHFCHTNEKYIKLWCDILLIANEVLDEI